MKKIAFIPILILTILFSNSLKAQNNILSNLKNKVVLYGTSVTSGDELLPVKRTGPEKQALFIFNFFKYITWPNKDTNDVFTINVMGDSGDILLNELKDMADNLTKTRKGKGMSFIIERVNSLDDVKTPQILYFDKSSELKLEDVYTKMNNQPTLVVTQGYPFGKSMINFIMDDNNVQYELNEPRCEAANLKVSKLLSIVAVKSQKEWDSLIDKMENLTDTDEETIKIDKKDLTKILNDQKRLLAEIEVNSKKLDKQKETLKVQKQELESKEKLIANAKKEINHQQNLINTQLQKIEIQQNNLANLNSNIEIKQKELQTQQAILEEEKQSLLAIQKEYAEIESKLKDKELLVSEQTQRIDEQVSEIFTKGNKIKEQESIIWLSLIFLIIVSILGGLAYRSYRLKNKANAIILAQKDEIEEQHEVLEEQHKEITDSINYAKRIQDAILPPLKLVKGYMPDSFILYKPKDIVAGDFYWMEGINNLIIFAAADCTGHGVPGAMVSVVCHNAMNRSVKEFMLVKPSDILDKTREIVMETFEKSDEDVNDGMDIALCSINTESNKLNFAGANNGLYLIRDNEVTQIKPDKQPIGNYKDSKPFTNHEMDLQKGDVIYAFSDGYPDQFGGPKGKKFMYKPFRNLLLEIHQKPMSEQHNILLEAFEDWRGELEQIDDVCVIGVRI
jgi:serine phosphatase RsbU (regulator of sigma subunit)